MSNIITFISQLEAALHSGDFQQSLILLKSWLQQAQPGQPEALLAACSNALRPKVSLLMQDLIACYPTTLVGVPVLICAQPDPSSGQQPVPSLKLPTPAWKDARPCGEELLFLKWLPAFSLLAVSPVEHVQQSSVSVEWQVATSVVALFCSRFGTFEVDKPLIPASWWASLLYRPEHCIHVGGEQLWPYPEALEAARLMQASARGEALPSGQYFLSNAAYRASLLESTQFQEKHHRLLWKDA